MCFNVELHSVTIYITQLRNIDCQSNTLYYTIYTMFSGVLQPAYEDVWMWYTLRAGLKSVIVYEVCLNIIKKLFSNTIISKMSKNIKASCIDAANHKIVAYISTYV